MKKVEGFQYETVLDINMGYYPIRLSPKSQDMKTIVTEVRKFRYNYLQMGMTYFNLKWKRNLVTLRDLKFLSMIY